MDRILVHDPLYLKKALVVSDSDWGLAELEGLLKTLGAKTEQRLKFIRRRIDPGTYLGSGKLQEIARIIESKNLDLLVVDFDLSPSQMKNIEKIVKHLVLDRSGLILEIFNLHARTKEAKLQVELARLEYLMPRLTHLWSHFERQRGAGGGALKGKGMGEKQIEVDRRLVKKRSILLHQKLKEVENARQLHRKHRESLLKVALVGYTNAGKSTLLNVLTASDVFVEDCLFATLDASIRLLNPKVRPAVLAIDTVGFIDRLPHGLVASFRSTLAEILEAHLLVQVLDASSPEVRRHFEVTMKVLEELGAKHIPLLVIFNKLDCCTDVGMLKVWGASLVRDYGLPQPLYMSAFEPTHVAELRDHILKYFDKLMETFEVIIPFADGKLMAQIHEIGKIEIQRETEKGNFLKLRTTPAFANQLNLERYRV